MLKKIYKHEMIMTSRTFIPMILGFIIITILSKVSFELTVNSAIDGWLARSLAGLFFTLYFIYVIAIFIVTAVLISTQFYKTMTSAQGYLTHTLPVKTHTIIIGKLLCAATWETASMILLCLSFGIFFLGHFSFEDISQLSSYVFQIFQEVKELNLPLVIFECVSSVVIGIFSSPLMLYASIALGQLFRNHRVLGSIISFFGFYVLMQIASTVMLNVFIIRMFSVELLDAYKLIGFFHGSILSSLLFSVICMVAFYWITHFIFTKKLNLE